jgi:2,3-bisphosphoglycerate-dependent phosphoglycerate mutase
MEIWLVRHAEPEWVRDGYNVDDPPLTGRGHRQARLLADALAGERFDEVLVSPLVRTRETAAPILEVLAAPLVVEPWLEEIRSPIWHGTPAEKSAEAYREARSRPADRQWDGLAGGESVRDFCDRIHLGARLFLAERGVERADGSLPVWNIAEPGRRILLVAHAGTNSVTLGHMLGLDPTPWEWDRFVLHHASISRLEAVPVGDHHAFGLTRLSDVEHLGVGLRTR